MSWKDGYNRAVTAFIIANGSAVRERNTSMYGWLADDYEAVDQHLRGRITGNGCPLVNAIVNDSAWRTFLGTFAEPQWEDRRGVDVTVTCTCGQIQGRVIRYEGTMSELITGVLALPDPADPERGEHDAQCTEGCADWDEHDLCFGDGCS